MRYLALLLLLLCAACAPVVYLTPAPVDYLAAGEIVRAATGTAIAMATQDALAATADWNARATSTAARQSTLDALSGQQTEVALEIAQRAQFDASTVTTSVLTQSAGQTQAWATPTAAAIRTQAALEAQAQAQRQAEAASTAEFWATLRTVLVALVIVAGLAWIAVRVVDRVSAIRLAALRERAEIAKAAFGLLPSGHWREWTPDQGYQVYPLPALPGLEAPPVIENQPPPHRNLAFEWRWRSACKRAVFAGIELGRTSGAGGRPRFGERDLAGPVDPWVINADGSPSSAGYRDLKAALVGAGVWVAMARKGTAFAPEWNEARFEREFDALPLPDLPTGEPPFVRAPIRSSPPARSSAAPQAEAVIYADDPAPQNAGRGVRGNVAVK